MRRAGKRQFTALTRYGEMVGLAFQIADDILDITGKQEEIGKDVGSDLKKGKKTFPGFYGLEESRRRANEVADKAIHSLRDFDRKADPLQGIGEVYCEQSELKKGSGSSSQGQGLRLYQDPDPGT